MDLTSFVYHAKAGTKRTRQPEKRKASDLADNAAVPVVTKKSEPNSSEPGMSTSPAKAGTQLKSPLKGSVQTESESETKLNSGAAPASTDQPLISQKQKKRRNTSKRQSQKNADTAEEPKEEKKQKKPRAKGKKKGEAVPRFYDAPQVAAEEEEQQRVMMMRQKVMETEHEIARLELMRNNYLEQMLAAEKKVAMELGKEGLRDFGTSASGHGPEPQLLWEYTQDPKLAMDQLPTLEEWALDSRRPKLSQTNDERQSAKLAEESRIQPICRMDIQSPYRSGIARKPDNC